MPSPIYVKEPDAKLPQEPAPKFYKLMENKVLKSLADEFSDIHLKSFNQQNQGFLQDLFSLINKSPDIIYL